MSDIALFKDKSKLNITIKRKYFLGILAWYLH